jgi:8-oxo-dGTP diphosphatase
MIRECEEEICVTPMRYEKVAHLIFDIDMQDEPPLHIDAHVFIATEWEGEPKETDELAPKWFALDNIPYKRMWQDDIMWLPFVLMGKKVEAKFTFDTDEQVKTASLTVVDKLG